VREPGISTFLPPETKLLLTKSRGKDSTYCSPSTSGYK